MTSSDTVLHAFEDWWGRVGSALLGKRIERSPDSGCELEAFDAGARWERERIRKLLPRYTGDKNTQWLDNEGDA